MIQSITPGAVGPSKNLWSLNMADIAELVARLRALAAKFDKLGGFTGEHFSDIWRDAVADANRLVEEIYDAGFLRSIAKMDEVQNIIEASGPDRSITKMFLFDVIVGFSLIPQLRMIADPGDDGVDVLREYWYLEPGLLKQKPIYVEDRRTVDLDDFQKRHGFDLCDRCACGCKMLTEVIEREMAADDRAHEDGVIDASARTMKWGDEEFTDIPARAIVVLKLLMEAYRDENRIVTLEEIQRLGFSVDGGMKSQVFKHKKKSHPVSQLIDDLGRGQYRLRHPRKDS
jgi:hypothetical protein